MSNSKRIPVIVCGGENGRAVVYGYVAKMPEVGQPVEIHNARMVLYWPATCGGIFGLATNGPKNETRITSVVAVVKDTCRQVLSVTNAASKLFDEWPNA